LGCFIWLKLKESRRAGPWLMHSLLSYFACLLVVEVPTLWLDVGRHLDFASAATSASEARKPSRFPTQQFSTDGCLLNAPVTWTEGTLTLTPIPVFHIDAPGNTQSIALRRERFPGKMMDEPTYARLIAKTRRTPIDVMKSTWITFNGREVWREEGAAVVGGVNATFVVYIFREAQSMVQLIGTLPTSRFATDGPILEDIMQTVRCK
jgi:hypothetical protein